MSLAAWRTALMVEVEVQLKAKEEKTISFNLICQESCLEEHGHSSCNIQTIAAMALAPARRCTRAEESQSWREKKLVREDHDDSVHG